MKCKHVDLKKEIKRGRGIYIYDIGCGQDIELCPDCNMNLAGEIMKQMAIETFLDTPTICSCKICDQEIKREDEEMFKKLNKPEVKNGRRGPKQKTRREKSKD